MQFWAFPYLAWFVLMFLLWFVRSNRQIMFWLYLWQLKEYHWGRFAAHFATAQGRKIFLNPLELAKFFLAVAGAVFLFFPRGLKIGFAGNQVFFDYLGDWDRLMGYYILALILIFALESAKTLYDFFWGNFLHPALTKKSILLVLASHMVLFGAALIPFFAYLGEMSLFDFCVAAFVLLVIDLVAPVLIMLVVLGLQPLTIREKKRILAQSSKVIESRPDLLTIGIAGSYGKSAVKELAAHILSQDFCVLKTLANQNTEIGIANRIINDLEPEHRIFVCEIGAVHRGRIKQVAGIIKPRIGILTGINRQHQAVFGSLQNIVDAKYEILEALPESGTAVINWQSSLARDNYESQKIRIRSQKIVFAGNDPIAADVQALIDKLSFKIVWQERMASINVNARGAFMTEPIMIALAGAVAAGMAFERAVEIINATDFDQFNIGVKKNSVGIRVLNSTYSSNPDGVLAHLDYLKLWLGKKAIIMPCLIELGGASKDVHFRIGEKIGQVCDLGIITTKECFGDIKKGAVSAGMKPENLIYSEKPIEISKIIKNRLFEGDIMLLEGRAAVQIINVLK